MVSLRRILRRFFSSSRQDFADCLRTERGARPAGQSSHSPAICRLDRRYGRTPEHSILRVVHALVDGFRWRTRHLGFCPAVLEVFLSDFDLGHCAPLQFLRHALLYLAMAHALALAVYLSCDLSRLCLDHDW